jgi:hypothetical protein
LNRLQTDFCSYWSMIPLAADGFPCSPTKECKEARRHGVIEFVVLVEFFFSPF